MGQLKDSNGFVENELQSLADKFPQQLQIEKLQQVGRPSYLVRLVETPANMSAKIDAPKLQDLPSSATSPGHPSISGLPDLPGSAATQNIPDLPVSAGLSALSDSAGLSGMPKISGVQASPGISNIPELPVLNGGAS